MGAMSTVASPVRDPAWQLSRTAIGLWVTQGVVGSLLLVIGAVVFAFAVPSEAPEPLPTLRWLLPVLAALYAVVAVGIRPWFRYRVHRWEVTADAVYTRSGWLSRTWTL